MSGLVVLVSSAYAQPPGLTVDEAVAMALSNNRQIHISEMEVSKNANAASAARTHLLPVISLGVDSGKLLGSTTLRIPAGSLGTVPGLGAFPQKDANIKSGTDWTTFGLLTIAQPISQIPRIKLGVQLAQEQTLLTAEQLRQRRQEVADEVKTACYQYLQCSAGVKAARSAVVFGDEAVRVAEEAAAKGAVLDQVVLEAKAKRASAAEQLVAQIDNVESARMHLNLLLGRDLLTELEIVEPTPAAALLSTREDVRAAAAKNRPEVKQAKRKAGMANLAAQIRRREDDPDFSMVLTAARPVGVDFLPDPILMLGFRLTWAPVDWGRRRSDMAAKTAEVNQALLAVIEAEQQVTLDADMKYRAVLRQRAAVATAEAEYDTAKEKARVAHERASVGMTVPKDVLEADYLLAVAEAKRTSVRCDLAIALSAMQRALGND